MSAELVTSPAIHYEPLSTERQEIRVLEVVPAADDTMVECTLRRISLLEDPIPSYETISYCWGPPRDPAFMKINGSVLVDKPRIVWIDAVCINQLSLDEKGHQVSFMSTIYRPGERNLVYLGEDNDGLAERAKQTVQKVVADMRAATEDFTLLRATLLHGGQYLYLDEGFNCEVDFEALEGLFSAQWFTRLWVVQEAVLAQSSLCHWGKAEFGLLDTVRAARWLNYRGRAARWLNYRGRHSPSNIHSSAGRRCATRMFDYLDPTGWYVSNQRSASGMIPLARHFEKTEPRDTIYAILGLIHADMSIEGGQSRLLEVDYNKPLSNVLRDATRLALYQDQDLWILRFIDHSSDDYSSGQMFPSWAMRSDRHPSSYKRGVFVTSFPYFSPKASKGMQAPSMLNDTSYGDNVLLGQGFLVDRILATTPTCGDEIYGYNSHFHMWLKSAKDLALDSLSSSSRWTEHDACLAIAFALVAGRAKSRLQAQPDDLSTLVKYIEDVPVYDKQQLLDMLAVSSTSSVLYRRFFVTASGRVGIGPRSMRPDDLVVILRGGDLPFISRRVNDQDYHLLGEAYVHGIMHGEAVQIHEAAGGSETVFPIR